VQNRREISASARLIHPPPDYTRACVAVGPGARANLPRIRRAAAARAHGGGAGRLPLRVLGVSAQLGDNIAMVKEAMRQLVAARELDASAVGGGRTPQSNVVQCGQQSSTGVY
jgi:hypothetical protein